jgi:hypothetical protein
LPASAAAAASAAAGGLGTALDAGPAYVTVARTRTRPLPCTPIENAPVLDNITAVNATHPAGQRILRMRVVITFSFL